MKFKKLSPEEYNMFLSACAAFVGLVVTYAPEEDKILMGQHFDVICSQIGGKKLVDDIHRRLDAILLAGALKTEMEDLKDE